MDTQDQKKLKGIIKACTYSLGAGSNSENILYDMYTGEITASQINVNQAVGISICQRQNFRKSLQNKSKENNIRAIRTSEHQNFACVTLLII